jgi:uncharacterized phage protein (TIGR01671 family)
MRIIKFRAWDKNENEMIPWSKEFFSDMSPATRWSSDFPNEEMGIILMQFTGLMDINGKEIYEGDITKYGYVITYVDGSKGEDLGMSVGFYEQRDNFESWSMLEGGAEYEIIGNIYENKTC